MYQHEKEKAQAAETTDGLTQLQAAQNDAFYNRDTGLMWKKGDSVFPQNADQDAGQQTMASLAKARDTIASKLSSEEAKKMFLLRANGMLESAHREAEVHVGEQRLVAQKASAQGLQATSLDALATNFADPEARARLIAQPEGSIKALALSKEDGAADLAAWRAKANATVLNQYVATKDWKGAQAYFAQVKADLGPASAQFEHTITTLKEQQQGNDVALQVLGDARKDNGFVDVAQAVTNYEALRPELRNEHTDAAFHKYLALEEAKQQKQTVGVFQSAFTGFLRSHSLSDVSAQDRSWLIQNAPEEWHKLEQMQLSWQGGRGGGVTPEQTGNFIKLLTQMDQNPLAFKGMDPAEFNSRYASQLTPGDWKQAGEHFAKLQQTKDYELQGNGAKVVTETFQKAFGEAKANPDSWTEQHQEFWRDVHDYVGKRATAYIKDHGGKVPSEEDLSKWAGERLVKGSVVGGGLIFGDANGLTRVAAEHVDRYKGKPFLPDIPSATEAAIRSKLKARGLAKPTDRQVRDFFDELSQTGAK
jgi:hypothetical protein